MTGFNSIGKFKYQVPDSLPDLLKILGKKTDAIKILAGGTDLIVQIKQGIFRPALMVDIKKIPELNRLDWDSERGLRLGAAVPISRLLSFTVLPKAYHVLIQACSLIGSWQIKNRATVGGNLCNAAPSADSAPALLCLNAKVVLASYRDTRVLPIEKFFLGPGKTALAEDEILVEVEIPSPPENSAGCYLRHTTREEMDIAVVGVAAYINLSPKDGGIESVRIGLGAVASTPMRARRSESVLEGKKISTPLIQETAELAAQEAEPISDLRGSAEYRRELVRVLTRRTLVQAGKELGLKV